ncbi:hypothetical protein SERLA73DRAFT_181372 [Serpula lacrymans var. lacrymans S7.3]|uniref:Uncharacterized protein n=2 Tax=Serpula lacrymans var. lacrymans TaxID=341189 RepID=F8PXY4_SERL3|nr:hypothetical protein SERLA73DRAFT_181372 [Serpula lacrymans var. lacrymans S7.3]
MNTLAEASSSSSNSRRKSSAQANGKDPPLSERGQQALKVVQEDMMRMLAEGRINTNVYGKNMPEGTGNGQVGEGSKFKPNEQNLKNRAREIKFTEHIDRAKAEQEAWVHVDQFYNSYQTNSLADLEKRRRALTPPSSLKAKGKQRATSVEPGDDWRWLLPREEELPEAFRGKNGVELAKRIMEERFESGEESPISQRMEDVRFKIDSLFSFTNSAVRMTETAEAELDHRFSLLSLVLSARAESAPPPTQSPTSLSSYLPLPSRGRSQPSSSDPQDLLRALCRVDLDRPPGKVGDAARRAAREVQRVQEGGGVGERRLTGIAPGIGATPRKVPGTPRRKDR